MAHGTFPVPPPAVAELLQGAPIYSTEIEGELITPTGAAIIATVCEQFGTIPEMIVEKTAYGAGTREYKDFPNVLRLIVGETAEAKTNSSKENNPQINTREHELKSEQSLKGGQSSKTAAQFLTLLETNIDDLSPQILGFVMERAFEFGAFDCWFTPIQMKKNRPATMISILCGEDEKAALTEMLYKETSTLGVRVTKIERSCLEREIIKVETEFGEIDVKIAKYDGKTVNAKPEYDQLREIAIKFNIPLREIEKIIIEKSGI
jgi:uncharacterized protein (TIGR00299 family) protein